MNCHPFLIGALASAALVVHGAPIRLDDSQSPRQRIETQARWSNVGDSDFSEDEFNEQVAEIVGFESRLRTAPYVGRNASIYLALPRISKGLRLATAMRLEWTSRGRFASGSVRPGDRALVFRGKIDAPTFVETIDLRILIDGRYLEHGLEFEPIFEIELDP